MPKKKESIETRIIKLRYHFLKRFKEQFKFSKFRRNKKKTIRSKLIQDQSINIVNFEFNLIRCRYCEKWARADLDSTRKCKVCKNNMRKVIRNLGYDWDGWGSLSTFGGQLGRMD